MPATTSAPSPAGTAGAKRKLTAILSADVAGFSRLMGADEAGTHRTLTAHRGVIDGLVEGRGGRVVGAAGDSVLADFPSVVDAVACAVEVQAALRERNAALPAERRLEFRIGINLGDVIVDGEEIYGDGVNVAARLQALAEPGGICISGGVYEQVRGKLDLGYRDRGAQRVKNIAEPVRVYAVEPADGGAPGGRTPSPAGRSRFRWRVAAALAVLAAAAAVTAVAVWPPASQRVETLASAMLGEGGRPEVQRTARPAVAVLPFANRSGDPDEAYFSDGVTEDIISALGRFSNLLVMSWNAVAPYKDESATPEDLRRDLGVRYVVTGSVRRAGDRLRVDVQLTDAERGALLWSGRYDEAVDDVFAVQDDITHRIVGALAVRFTDLEQERAFGKPTDSLDAYDHVLRGREHWRRLERSANLKAREMFERAIDLDPDYADAYAALGWTYMKAAEHGWTEWPHDALQRAYDLAQEAVRLDPSNTSAHTLLGSSYFYQGRHELALREIDRAIELNPNHVASYADRGWVLIVSGRSGQAIRSLEEALRFDPSPTPNTAGNLALTYYLQGRYDDAVVTAERNLGRNPHHVPSYIVLAAAHAQAGRAEDAARAAAELRRLYPFFTIDEHGTLFRDPADREHIAEGLRKAGLE